MNEIFSIWTLFEANLFKIEHLCPSCLKQMVSCHPCSSERRWKLSIFVGVPWYSKQLHKISLLHKSSLITVSCLKCIVQIWVRKQTPPKMVPFLTPTDPMHMKQDAEVSYFCGATLFCGSAPNIRTLQQRWMIFNTFQMTKDGTKPFILKMKGIGHRCSILKKWVPSCTHFLRNILRDFCELPQRGRHLQLI